MPLTFPGLDYAFSLTLGLYELDTINDFTSLYFIIDPQTKAKYSDEIEMFRYVDKTLKEKEEKIFNSHVVLANEIEQVALTHSPNSFHYFFNMLGDVVKHPQIEEVDFDKIRQEVAVHNREALAFNATINKAAFIQYRYTINPVYLERYLIFLATIVNNFKLTIEKHLKLYKEGKLLPNGSFQPQSSLKQPELLKEERPKLKFKISKPYVAYLFKMLFEHAILDVKGKEELYRFIESNIITPETEKRGKTSAGGFRNAFDFPQKATADYWVRMFEKMKQKAEREEGKKRKK